MAKPRFNEGLSGWTPRRFRAALAALVAIVCAFVTTTAARAQGADAPPVTAEQYGRLCDVLELTDAQKTAAKLLFDGSLDAFRPHLEAQRQAMGTWSMSRKLFAKGSPERAIAQRIFTQALYDFYFEYGQAERSLMLDLKSILTVDQADRLFPLAERAQRREQLKLVYCGLTAWQALDLCTITDEAPLSPADRQLLKPILEQYALELDIPLKRYVDLLARQDAFQHGHGRTEQERADEKASVSPQIDALTARFATINRRVATQIEATLPEPAASAVREAVRERVYALARMHAGERACLEEAERLGDLTVEQRDGLTRIRAEHAAKATAYDAWRISISEKFESGDRSDYASAEDLNKAAGERADALAGALATSIKGVLTPEQAGRLHGQERKEAAK